MQNTFSQLGNDSKWFLKKSFFKIGMWHSRPPPFMANAILNFHFDYWHTSLIHHTALPLTLWKQLCQNRNLKKISLSNRYRKFVYNVSLEREYCQRNFWNAEKEKLLLGPTLVRVDHTNPAEENRKYCAICSQLECQSKLSISTFLSQQVMTLDKTNEDGSG